MYSIFKRTLNLIPNGIIILDTKSKKVQLLNDEMKNFISENQSLDPLKDLEDEQVINGLSKFSRFDSEISENLWQFILLTISSMNLDGRVDSIFKTDKRYL